MKRIFISAAVLIAAVTLSAQELKTYSGSFKGGEATYTYYENDDGRVFEGKFQWKVAPFFYNLNDSKLEIVGSFKNNMRDGLWTYTVTDKKEILRVHKVNYSQGVPNGKYEFKGKILGEYALSTTMKNGKADGPVRIKLPNSVITGEYTQNTRTGVWERKFSNGSFYHIKCDSSKASYYVSEYWGDWKCYGRKQEGNFFYDVEDGRKSVATEYDMLYAPDHAVPISPSENEIGGVTYPVDATIHNNCLSLERHFDFGIVIPKEEPKPIPSGNSAKSQSNIHGTSEPALSTEEIILRYKQNNAKTETEKLRENLERLGFSFRKKKK